MTFLAVVTGNDVTANDIAAIDITVYSQINRQNNLNFVSIFTTKPVPLYF